MNKQGYIYILTNKGRTTLYTGVTSNLIGRIWQHKNKVFKGFSCKYNLTDLVYYEVFDNVVDAIKREKQIKAGSRASKERLIDSTNLGWVDLYQTIG